jgi:hypothetical protein
VAVLKLWIVQPDEVVARLAPHDQLRYVEMAAALIDGRWLGAYDHMTLIREPGYAVWIAAVSALGVPLRLAAEGPLLAAALLFGWALVRTGLPAFLAFACYVSIVLQPASLLVNREVLAAGLYGPALIASVAGLLLCNAATGTRRALLHAAWTGLALGVAWTTRPEKPLLLLLLATWAGLEWLALRARNAPPRAAAGRIGGVLLASLAGIALLATALTGMNARRYGVFATSELSRPGFTAAQRELRGIPHAAPRRFVLVPREARRRAYAVSPALREIEPHLERPGWAHAVSCNLVRVCDDIAGGWLMWAMRDAAAEAGYASNASQLDAYWQRVADELQQARARGDLPPRRTALPFVHPHPETFTPHLWKSVRLEVRRIASRGSARDRHPAGDGAGTPAEVRALFDRVAQRRAAPSAHATSEHSPRGRVRDALWSANALAIRGAALAGSLAIVALMLPRWRGRAANPALRALVLIAVAVLSRIALLALIDASSAPTRSTRYVYPVAALSTCGMLVAAHAAWRHARTVRAGRG